MNKKYAEQLTNLGPTKGEARAYLALIQIGPSKWGKIVEMSGVSIQNLQRFGPLDSKRASKL